MARKNPPPAVPRPIMIGIAILIVSSMALAVLGRLSREAANEAQPPIVAESQELRFETAPDGTITVIATDDTTIAALKRGEDGFVRVVLQSLRYQRHRQAQDQDAAFRLLRFPDGRLRLSDPTTGSHVNLNAFGDDNLSNFEPILAAGILEK